MPFVGRFLTCTRGTLVDQWFNYCFGLCPEECSGVVLGLSRGSPYSVPSKSLPTPGLAHVVLVAAFLISEEQVGQEVIRDLSKSK